MFSYVPKHLHNFCYKLIETEEIPIDTLHEAIDLYTNLYNDDFDISEKYTRLSSILLNIPNKSDHAQEFTDWFVIYFLGYHTNYRAEIIKRDIYLRHMQEQNKRTRSQDDDINKRIKL